MARLVTSPWSLKVELINHLGQSLDIDLFKTPLKIKTIKNLKIKNCFSGAMILRSRLEEYSWNIERDLHRRKRQELFPKDYETFYGAYLERYNRKSGHARG